MIDFAEQGHTLVTGFPISASAVAAATVGSVYGVAQLSGTSSTEELSKDSIYPYYSRLSVENTGYAYETKDAIVYYSQLQDGWDNVAVIATITEFTTNLAKTFIDICEPEISITTYQQFLRNEVDISVELGEIKKSKSRIVVALLFADWEPFIAEADKFGLVGDNYVWIVPPTVTGYPFLEPSPVSRGTLGSLYFIPENTPEIENFNEIWDQLDPEKYPGAGPDQPASALCYRAYDMMIATAIALTKLEETNELGNNQYISPNRWNEVIRDVSFFGLSGEIAFYPNGNRIGNYSIRYYVPETNSWTTSMIWSEEEGLRVIRDVIWHSNTTDIPDLDIREPFDYWSCHDKKEKTDKTGKTVVLHSPDGSDIDDIDIDYHCDHFIDCKNLSDESSDGCSTNFLIAFIIFGIITGLLILLCIVLIIFVLLFGIQFQYRRLRIASPFFLNILLISMIIGYSSIYAWFGKPHPVACGFQPWLLGLSAMGMIAALSVKNFRIWRIFAFPLDKVRITDLELLILWIIVMIPAVIILTLWTIISTPTAKLESFDGEDHYVCATGGFTGEPGGYVFFGIFVGYCGLVLLIGAIISIVARNVPSYFNETKLLAISIYNLVFLGVVIIPVFLVVKPYNPFIAWILRTCAILYAFTATLMIQFLPILFGIFIIDKGQNVKVFKSVLKTPETFGKQMGSLEKANGSSSNNSLSNSISQTM